MIRSTKSLGSLGGVVCQFLCVSGDQASVDDVSKWLATKPWVNPFGRVAVVFEAIPELVQTAIMSSLARTAYYELMVHTGAGYVTVASVDPQRIGTEYALFSTCEEVLSRVGNR